MNIYSIYNLTIFSQLYLFHILYYTIFCIHSKVHTFVLFSLILSTSMDMYHLLNSSFCFISNISLYIHNLWYFIIWFFQNFQNLILKNHFLHCDLKLLVFKYDYQDLSLWIFHVFFVLFCPSDAHIFLADPTHPPCLILEVSSFGRHYELFSSQILLILLKSGSSLISEVI